MLVDVDVPALTGAFFHCHKEDEDLIHPLTTAMPLACSQCPPSVIVGETVGSHSKGRFTRYNFVACDKLTTSLRHESFRVNQAYNLLTIVAYDTKNVVGF